MLKSKLSPLLSWFTYLWKVHLKMSLQGMTCQSMLLYWPMIDSNKKLNWNSIHLNWNSISGIYLHATLMVVLCECKRFECVEWFTEGMLFLKAIRPTVIKMNILSVASLPVSVKCLHSIPIFEKHLARLLLLLSVLSILEDIISHSSLCDIISR